MTNFCILVLIIFYFFRSLIPLGIYAEPVEVLYLFYYGFRFAPAATKKDAVPIEARVAVIIAMNEVKKQSLEMKHKIF